MSDSFKLPVIQPLADSQRRVIRYLRVSLTDRCNYRCTYCMPEEGVDLRPRSEVLSFEELERVVRVFCGLGVERVRLTGGEPTVRKDVVELVNRLGAIEGLRSLVMTTNAHRLEELAEPLAKAGLAEVNVSIDTLDAQRFRELTRRGDLGRVLAGIDAARAAGLRVKLNAVALRGVNEGELFELCAYAWDRGLVTRFIEHMPMSDGALYRSLNHLGAAEIRQAIAERLGGALVAEATSGAVGPARYWHLEGHPEKRFGIISAMSEHFCDDCNRLRLTAHGDLHACLGYDDATGLREPLRAGASDAELVALIADAVSGKRPGHSFALSGDGAPTKHMVSIGG